MRRTIVTVFFGILLTGAAGSPPAHAQLIGLNNALDALHQRTINFLLNRLPEPVRNSLTPIVTPIMGLQSAQEAERTQRLTEGLIIDMYDRERAEFGDLARSVSRLPVEVESTERRWSVIEITHRLDASREAAALSSRQRSRISSLIFSIQTACRLRQIGCSLVRAFEALRSDLDGLDETIDLAKLHAQVQMVWALIQRTQGAPSVLQPVATSQLRYPGWQIPLVLVQDEMARAEPGAEALTFERLDQSAYRTAALIRWHENRLYLRPLSESFESLSDDVRVACSLTTIERETRACLESMQLLGQEELRSHRSIIPSLVGVNRFYPSDWRDETVEQFYRSVKDHLGLRQSHYRPDLQREILLHGTRRFTLPLLHEALRERFDRELVRIRTPIQ